MRQIKLIMSGRAVIFISLIVTSIVTAIRWTGGLQNLETIALDNSFQTRHVEPQDRRFLIVSIEETDLHQLKQWPINDKILAKALSNIKQQHPLVIGLDIYRDFPVEPGNSELTKIFKNTPNLIGVRKEINDAYSASIAPNPILAEQGQIAANDVIVDSDGVVRRGTLYPKTSRSNVYSSNDELLPSLGLVSALIYLEETKGIVPEYAEKGFLKLGKTVFVPFENSDGGYVRTDAGGYQILLNYRGPAESFPHVSFTDVLYNRIPPNIMRGRIVLIGAGAPSLNDKFYTPYSRKLGSSPIRTPGVEIQANLASQIISSVLDKRPLIKVLHFPLTELWLLLYTTLICTIIYLRKCQHNLIIIALGTTAILVIVCYWISQYAFLKGWWLPCVPPIIGILISTVIMLGYIYLIKLRQTVRALNQKNKENTILYEQLSDYSRNLEAKVELRTKELKLAQKELLIREKMAALGNLVAGVAHEISTPIGNSVLAASALSTQTKLLLEAHRERQMKRSELEKYLDTASESSRLILSNLNVAAQLIQSFKQVAVDTSGSPLREFNLHEYIEDTLLNLKPKLKMTQHEISVLGDSTIKLNSYPGYIAQICNNLVINSLDHAYDNGDSGQLVFEFHLDGDRIILTYSDDGKGIPPENLDKIFDPFFTTNRGKGGSGLGLNIVYNIINQKLRGSISVESSVGRGTKFTINLPQSLNI